MHPHPKQRRRARAARSLCSSSSQFDDVRSQIPPVNESDSDTFHPGIWLQEMVDVNRVGRCLGGVLGAIAAAAVESTMLKPTMFDLRFLP